MDPRPFLRIPPFPGAKVSALMRSSDATAAPSDIHDEDLQELIRTARVGGTYWAAQPKLPAGCLLVRSDELLCASAALAEKYEPVLWQSRASTRSSAARIIVTGDCDPWHMLSLASAVVLERDDEIRAIAAMLQVPAYLYNRHTGQLERDCASVTELLGAALLGAAFTDPFSGQPMSKREAVELCGFWRKLIDSNRDLGSGLGFAFWKQAHVAPLLWGGSEPFRFIRDASEVKPGFAVAVWRSKASPDAVQALDESGSAIVEVEDGFLRSRGLGADCVPPLSITVDRHGVHFDPRCPSELEQILQAGMFDEALIDRARRLRKIIVDAGLGKYERGTGVVGRRAANRRHILVPGQVEDDRSVQTGGCGLQSNLELLRRVREQADDAFIIYKPHPDVLAGHRRGAIAESDVLRHADEIVSDAPMSSLIAMVDEVHVNTSLAGFEALLRGKQVTTYGVPFYAGWGLTDDLGPVPARRNTRRSLDELVAAALLLYPRYLDPLTGLPCQAEVVIQRLIDETADDAGLLVRVRRIQGKLMRGFRNLVQ